MTSYTTSDYTHRVRIKDPTRTYYYPLDSYRTCSFDEGKHGEGQLSVQFEASQVDLPLADIVRTDAWGWTVEVVMEPTPGNERVVWYGPILKQNIEYSNKTVIQWEAESMIFHLLRRRLAQTSDNEKWVSADAATTYAGPMAYYILYRVLIATGANLWVPPYPVAYRNDYGPWYAEYDAFDAIPNGNTLYLDESPGNNAWDAIVHLLEAGDLVLEMEETTGTSHPRLSGTRPLFKFSLDSPWSNTDLSGIVVLSNVDGSITGLRHQIDSTGLANAWLMKGAGEGSTQKAAWDRDSTSWVTNNRGAFEDTATMSDLSDLSALASERSHLLANSEPLETFEVDLNPFHGPRFNLDYFRRDSIDVWHTGMADLAVGPTATAPEHTGPVTLSVVGWKCDLKAGVPYYTLTAGDLPLSWTRRLRDKVGQHGGFFNGGRFARNSGSSQPGV